MTFLLYTHAVIPTGELAKLEKWFPLQGEQAFFDFFFENSNLNPS